MSAMSSVLMVFLVSGLTDPASTGPVTMSGAEGVSGAPVSRCKGCAAEKSNDRQSYECPETSHCLNASFAPDGVRRCMSQNPNLPTIELAEAALARSGRPSSCSVVRNSE